MATTQGLVWLITGANRGIGLELVKQLLPLATNTIVAASRDPSSASELKTLASGESTKGRLHLVKLDVGSTPSVKAAAAEVGTLLGGRGVDYLFNNAGVSTYDQAFGMDPDAMDAMFQTNVYGPARVSQAFLPLLERSVKKTVVNVSSPLGSFGNGGVDFTASYSISKAALNMLTFKQAKEKPELTIVSIAPGWLRTDLGGPNAPLSVSEGVEGTLKVVNGLTLAKSGRFFDYTGTEVPW